jgi:hypothetical protein
MANSLDRRHSRRFLLQHLRIEYSCGVSNEFDHAFYHSPWRDAFGYPLHPIWRSAGHQLQAFATQ